MADLNHMSNYRLETGNFQIGASDSEAHVCGFRAMPISVPR
jgi:hypothetical protein